MKSELKKEYQKEKKKQKIKNIFKWVAVGIGWTALCSLFIGLVCVGVKGCSTKNKQNKNDVVVVNSDIDNYHKVATESNDNEHVFNKKRSITGSYDGELLCNPIYLPINNNELTQVDNFLRGSDYDISWSQGALTINGNNRSVKTSIVFDDDIGGYIVNYYYGPPRIVGTFTPTLFASFLLEYQNNDNTNCATLLSSFGSCFITTQWQLFDSFSTAYDYFDFDEIYFWWGLLLGYNSNPINDVATNFTFQNQINRYGVLNLTNSEVIISDTTYVGKNICFSGLFSDMLGNRYKNILIEYKTGNNIGYVGTDGEKHIYDGTGLYYYGLYYRDLNNNDILVNKWVYENTNDGHYYTNKSEWLDYTYQNITIYSYDDVNIVFPINSLTGLNRLNVFNNNNGGGGSTGDNGLINAFTLLRMAFQSIANILNITILPGITIGTFIFIPLVVMIVIFIVWLFKR